MGTWPMWSVKIIYIYIYMEAEEYMDMDMDEPMVEPRFEVFVELPSGIVPLILEAVYYEEDTTYREIIEGIQSELGSHVPGHKDNPKEVKLRVIPKKGRFFIVSIHDQSVVDKEVQDGDRIYAHPQEYDLIAKGVTTKEFNKSVHQQQLQGSRLHKGGKITKRSKKGTRVSKRKRSRKFKRKRSRKK